MNDIFKRISVRKYKNIEVEEEKINALLKAAMQAPSARNKQSWHFVVIKDRKILKDISLFHPYAQMLNEADLAILVCGDLKIEDDLGYNTVNCAAATQNILLEAVNQGLGTCWLGVYPRQERMKEISDLINLPQYIVPISLIAVGYPNEERKQEERFLQERIKYDRW